MQASVPRTFGPAPQMPWSISSARSSYDAYSTMQAPLIDILGEAAVRMVDDDYYDVQPDEVDQEATAFRLSSHHHLFPATAFVPWWEFSTTTALKQVASPLKNPATARFFAHFISDTGPSLSIFERHVRRTSVLANRGATPLASRASGRRSCRPWPFTAKGLLHAMLAFVESAHRQNTRRESDAVDATLRVGTQERPSRCGAPAIPT
ncbi:hypothetical protein MRB53_037754 [Persea americana]|nr:hypothetical protein MRB53_037754 [Persea americana]